MVEIWGFEKWNFPYQKKKLCLHFVPWLRSFTAVPTTVTYLLKQWKEDHFCWCELGHFFIVCFWIESTDGQNSTNNIGMFGCVGLAKLGRMEGRSTAVTQLLSSQVWWDCQSLFMDPSSLYISQEYTLHFPL